MTVPILSRGSLAHTTGAFNYRISGTRRRKLSNGCSPRCTDSGHSESGGTRSGVRLPVLTKLNGQGSSLRIVAPWCTEPLCRWRRRERLYQSILMECARRQLSPKPLYPWAWVIILAVGR